MYSRSTGEVNSNSYVFATSKVNPKLESLLSKSLTTLEVMTYYLVVHTGPEQYTSSMLYSRDIPFWSGTLWHSFKKRSALFLRKSRIINNKKMKKKKRKKNKQQKKKSMDSRPSNARYQLSLSTSEGELCTV